MGFSSGSSSQDSSGSSYGYNQSLAQSISGNVASSIQDVWGPQAGPLSQMYAGAAGLAGSQNRTVPGAARANMAGVMPGARQGFDLAQQYATPNSALLRRQTSDLADVVGNEFSRTILPQIRTGAGIGGNIGGSREALAQGVAAGDAASAISRGATDLRANAWNTGANVASMLPGMAGDVFNLGMMPFQAAWAPYSSLAGILGGPTTLGRSSSRGYSRSMAQALGENWSEQESTGRSSNFGFNLW